MSKMLPRVFITQETSTVDYTPATKYGDLIFVTGINDRLSIHSGSFNNQVIVERVKTILSGFQPDDYLVCSGAPAMMALVGSIIGDRLKNILVWDNRTMKYNVLNVGDLI